MCVYKINSKALVLSICCVLYSVYCIAQNLYFQSYSSAEGLSQNSIYSIAETRDGFMWFGTQDGINRFDGRNFININPAFTTDSSQAKYFGRISKMITALYADKNDWLWVGTTQGIALYNRYKNKFFLPASIYKGFSLLEEAAVSNIVEDDKENIWIVTQNEGLLCYNKTRRAMTVLNWQGTAPEKIVALCIDKRGDVWVSSEHEIYKLKGTTLEPLGLQKKLPLEKILISDMNVVNNQLWFITNSSEIILLQPDEVNDYSLSSFSKEFQGGKYLSDARVIHQSDSNTVWIGSRSEGLIKIDLAAKTFVNAGAAGTNYSLKKQFVLSFFTNRQKITWIGLSGGGIAKYDLQKVQFDLWRNEPLPGKAAPDNMLLSVFSDNDEDFYMGTLYGGLLRTNIKTGKYDYYEPPLFKYDEPKSKNIYQIIAGDNNLLWMATMGGLYSFDIVIKHFTQYTDANDEQTKELCAVIKLKKQNKMLVGGYRDGLRLFNPETKKWDTCKDNKNVLGNYKLRVRYMKEMEDGNIYMSTETQNLVRYNYVTGEFTFFPQFQNVSGTSRYFCFDSLYLWLATDDGLIQASTSTMQIIKIWSTDNGLSNNVIYAVVPDNNGHIWVSSNEGLVMIDYTTGVCKKFTEDDGLQGMEFNTASCYKDKEGKIWFGGINGLNMVNPGLSVSNLYSPAPLITSINIMNIPYQSDTATPYIHTISLPYSKNFISFEFQSPNFSQSENIVYEYKLQGVDTGWVNNGTRNYVSYTQLNPGEYIFHVRSANNNGTWSKGYAEILLIITPPWFKTWWFYSLLTIVTGTGLYLFFRYRINQVRKVERMRQHISADLHDDIGASLTSINILSQLSQQKKIDTATRNEYLHKINEQTAEVTDALRDIVWSINPKNDKLDIILARMKRYTAELLEPKNIEYSFETNITSTGETLHADIRQNLYLIFKEAVNNLAKYSGATKAVIVVNKHAGHLYLKVKDNGLGFDPVHVTKGNGLENMQRRAKAMHTRLNLSSENNIGTTITVNIPL